MCVSGWHANVNRFFALRSNSLRRYVYAPRRQRPLHTHSLDLDSTRPKTMSIYARDARVARVETTTDNKFEARARPRWRRLTPSGSTSTQRHGTESARLRLSNLVVYLPSRPQESGTSLRRRRRRRSGLAPNRSRDQRHRGLASDCNSHRVNPVSYQSAPVYSQQIISRWTHPSLRPL